MPTPTMPRSIASQSYMSKAQIQWFRERLDAHLLSLKVKLQGIREDIVNAPQEGIDELDRAALEDEIGKARALEQRYRQEASSYRCALEAMDRGDYGYCADTGEEIGLPRLHARPDALYCIGAQERNERRSNQYASQAAFA